MFYHFAQQFSHNCALYEIATGETVTYAELDERIDALAAKIIRDRRRLVFIAASNSIAVVAFYLACLRCRCPVYLFDPAKNIDALIERYKPNIIAYPDNNSFETHYEAVPAMNEALALLLSTSGSTGTPKFVKLSSTNIHSNAESIAQYLNIDCHHRALGHLRLFYSYGLSVLHSHLAVGASVYLSNDGAMDENFWLSIARFNLSSFAGVPFTFQSLRRSGLNLAHYPSLKYLSQAGGKLAPEDVIHWATECERNRMQFFVMYGQTEAAPRISYLPPQLCRAHPDAIGVAIPGGTLSLINAAGQEIPGNDVEGELCYHGPNVMMGYAESATDLAEGSHVGKLLTGDIASRNALGLYKIVGRRSRFIKPLGIRINLDDIERYVDQLCPGTVCTGSDEDIVLAGTSNSLKGKVAQIASHAGLPGAFFTVVKVPEIPRLSNGKTDYNSIKALAARSGGVYVQSSTAATRLSAAFSFAFLKSWAAEAGQLVGLGERSASVREIFSRVFVIHETEVDMNASFKDYGGDSMKYVSASIELESLLGYLPENWEDQSVEALESVRFAGAM